MLSRSGPGSAPLSVTDAGEVAAGAAAPAENAAASAAERMMDVPCAAAMQEFAYAGMLNAAMEVAGCTCGGGRWTQAQT